MSLRPILEGAQEWHPTVDTAEVFGRTHFAKRAAERGVRSVPGHLLLWMVLEAHRGGHADLIAKVWPICEESTAYRILLPEGAFYPVIRGIAAVTIYNQDQIRMVRKARRLRKRMTGSRIRRVVGGVAGNEW